MSKLDQDQLQQQIAELEQRLSDLLARLPAHSTPPAMAMELDALEEAIADLHQELHRHLPEG